jgi:hypothetical protein
MPHRVRDTSENDPHPLFLEDCQIVTCSRLIPALVLVDTKGALRGEIAMRAPACIILSLGTILIAAPAWASGRYDPDYPICMESISSEGTRIDCEYTSIETCRQGVLGGSSGTCFNNPYYVAPPPEPVTAPQTEPAPPVKPVKSAKSAKSTKSQSPPSPQPAQSQQR